MAEDPKARVRDFFRNKIPNQVLLDELVEGGFATQAQREGSCATYAKHALFWKAYVQADSRIPDTVTTVDQLLTHIREQQTPFHEDKKFQFFKSDEDHHIYITFDSRRVTAEWSELSELSLSAENVKDQDIYMDFEAKQDNWEPYKPKFDLLQLFVPSLDAVYLCRNNTDGSNKAANEAKVRDILDNAGRIFFWGMSMDWLALQTFFDKNTVSFQDKLHDLQQVEEGNLKALGKALDESFGITKVTLDDYSIFAEEPSNNNFWTYACTDVLGLYLLNEKYPERILRAREVANIIMAEVKCFLVAGDNDPEKLSLKGGASLLKLNQAVIKGKIREIQEIRKFFDIVPASVDQEETVNITYPAPYEVVIAVFQFNFAQTFKEIEPSVVEDAFQNSIILRDLTWYRNSCFMDSVMVALFVVENPIATALSTTDDFKTNFASVFNSEKTLKYMRPKFGSPVVPEDVCKDIEQCQGDGQFGAQAMCQQSFLNDDSSGSGLSFMYALLKLSGFDPNSLQCKLQDAVLVPTDDGPEIQIKDKGLNLVISDALMVASRYRGNVPIEKISEIILADGKKYHLLSCTCLDKPSHYTACVRMGDFMGDSFKYVDKSPNGKTNIEYITDGNLPCPELLFYTTTENFDEAYAFPGA
jgi:hypothetical protein